MQRLLSYLEKARSSLWFVPALLSVGAIFLVPAALYVDHRLADTKIAELARSFSGGPEGARELLGTIAGSMITIAGVTFSITVVALVLASNQFAPRVLRNFMRDRGNQIVLGSFVATFLYSLLVLRSIRTGDNAYVPAFAVGLAIVFAVVNLGLYIYFIHHISDSIRVGTIVQAVARETHQSIDRWFDAEGPTAGSARRVDSGPSPDSWSVMAPREGYVQSVADRDLRSVAEEHGVDLWLAAGPGDFVHEGRPLAHADRVPQDPDELESSVRSSFFLGSGRTLTQDPSYGFRQLVDIAVKALSPGINDPTTAVTCLHYLESLLSDLGTRDSWPSGELADDDGQVRVRVPRQSWESYVELAFLEISRYGRGDLATLLRLARMVHHLGEVVSDPERRGALRDQLDRLRDLVAGESFIAADRERLESALGEARRVLREPFAAA